MKEYKERGAERKGREAYKKKKNSGNTKNNKNVWQCKKKKICSKDNYTIKHISDGILCWQKFCDKFYQKLNKTPKARL